MQWPWITTVAKIVFLSVNLRILDLSILGPQSLKEMEHSTGAHVTERKVVWFGTLGFCRGTHRACVCRASVSWRPELSHPSTVVPVLWSGPRVPLSQRRVHSSVTWNGQCEMTLVIWGCLAPCLSPLLKAPTYQKSQHHSLSCALWEHGLP